MKLPRISSAFLPNGDGKRKLIAWVVIAQGIGYAAIVLLGADLTTSFRIQSRLMPIWAWAVFFVVVGSAMYATTPRRHLLIGRGTAGVALLLSIWSLFTCISVMALPAAGLYAVFSCVLFGESWFKPTKIEL